MRAWLHLSLLLCGLSCDLNPQPSIPTHEGETPQPSVPVGPGPGFSPPPMSGAPNEGAQPQMPGGITNPDDSTDQSSQPGDATMDPVSVSDGGSGGAESGEPLDGTSEAAGAGGTSDGAE